MFFERKSASSFPHRIPLKYNFSLAELILGSFCYYEMQNNSVELVDPSIAFKTTWSDFFVCWWYNSVPFLTHIYTDCLARGCLNGWKSRMVANSTFQKAPNNVKCKESMYTHQLWDYTNSVELNTQTHTHTHNQVTANKLVWFLKKLPTSKWISAMSVWDVHSKRREKKTWIENKA